MRRVRHLNDESGMAMIMVIGTAVVMFIFATLIAVRALNDVRQARTQRLHTQAIHVADAGLERGLHAVDDNAAFDTGVAAPAFANVGAEKTWVLSQAATASTLCPAAGPTDGGPYCYTNSAEGQWVIIRPTAGSTIYGVGYIPTKANPVRVRVVRGTFDSGNQQTTFAVLTGGASGLTIAGSTTINGTGGVHSNGNISLGAGATVGGPATAVGSYSATGATVGANSGGGRPPITAPIVLPRDNYSKSEYDLCPDGTVKTGPAFTGGSQAPSTSSTPCQGTTLATATSSAYRGWRRTTASDSSKGAIWTQTGTMYDGTFYVYQGSANITGRYQHSRASVFAEATPATGTEPHCPHVGGDIEFVRAENAQPNHHIAPSATAHPLMFVAGRDLRINARWHPAKNEGVFVAHEQFEITGAGTGGLQLTGAIIASDVCHTAGSPVSTNSLTAVTLTYNGYAIPPGEPRLVNWSEI